ncbi:hypothetical protein QE152_g24351 [Popillia japonica]|uniref:Uncharacterized protein n=1 Tax=Popillia japonica TaxID=7064 RepID=A0AAW1KF77_POPJA
MKTRSPLFLVVLPTKTTPAQLNKTHQPRGAANARLPTPPTAIARTPVLPRLVQTAGGIIPPATRAAPSRWPTRKPGTEPSRNLETGSVPDKIPEGNQPEHSHQPRPQTTTEPRNRQRPRQNTRRKSARAFPPAPPPDNKPWKRAPTEPMPTHDVARTDEDYSPLHTPETPSRIRHPQTRVSEQRGLPGLHHLCQTHLPCPEPRHREIFSLHPRRRKPAPTPEETPPPGPEEQDRVTRPKLLTANPQLTPNLTGGRAYLQ